MTEQATVWMAPLQRGGPTEIKGELSLDDGGLRFAGEEGTERRIGLSSIVRVKRVAGSPIVMVRHTEEGRTVQTAFYFTQPPALEPAPTSTPQARPLSKGRRRRVAANYLGEENTSRKPEIMAWVREIRSAVERNAGIGDTT